MSKPKPGAVENERLTAAGCVLTTLSIVVIIASAFPIVFWTDAHGRPLPRSLAILSPILIGAAFHGIGTAILWLFGLKVLIKPAPDKPDWPEL
jgi:hypothetical protein